MKVRELIAALQELDQELPVLLGICGEMRDSVYDISEPFIIESFEYVQYNKTYNFEKSVLICDNYFSKHQQEFERSGDKLVH